MSPMYGRDHAFHMRAYLISPGMRRATKIDVTPAKTAIRQMVWTERLRTFITLAVAPASEGKSVPYAAHAPSGPLSWSFFKKAVKNLYSCCWTLRSTEVPYVHETPSSC